MNRNTYYYAREFGYQGWRSFPSALFLSDRVDTWIPSGDDIERAHSAGLLPFSQDDMIELVESGLLRVAGRIGNFVSDSPQAKSKLFTSSKSRFDQYIRQLVLSGNAAGKVDLHDEYTKDCMGKALEDLRRSLSSDLPRDRYALARSVVLSDKIKTPEIVVTRADQFSAMKLREIRTEPIREAVSLVKETVPDEFERTCCHQTFQLMRLSLEHDMIRERQGCDVHFDPSGMGSIFRAVAGQMTTCSPVPVPRDEHVRQLFDIVESLLEESQQVGYPLDSGNPKM